MHTAQFCTSQKITGQDCITAEAETWELEPEYCNVKNFLKIWFSPEAVTADPQELNHLNVKYSTFLSKSFEIYGLK